MNRSVVFKIVMALVLVAAILGLGAFAYRAGMVQGLAFNAQAQAGEAVRSPLPYYPVVHGYPYYGFGGVGFLSCLAPLFLLFLVFIAFRGLFWAGSHPWGHMDHRPWGRREPGQGPPTIFTEWHRQAHAQPPTEAEEE